MEPCTYPEQPMTQLESLLKKCYFQKPEIVGQILQPEELSAYIAWMIDTFSQDPKYQLTDVILPSYSSDVMQDLGTRLLHDPHNKSTFDLISSGYSHQVEERYMFSGYDISVERMLRYMPAHWHSSDYFEVYYALSGTCPVCFADDQVLVRPGTVLIVAPYVLRATPCYQDDQVLLNFHLRRSTFESVFWDQLPSENLLYHFFRIALSSDHPNAYLQFETSGDRQILDLLDQIQQEFAEKKQYGRQMMNTLMTTFFLLLLRRYEGTARLPRSKEFYWKHEFSAILSYIQTHYNTVRMADLTQAFHYSDRQITRIVQHCTGLTFIALITRLRMEHAADMLCQEMTSIEGIAYEVGYMTLSSFYRTFHKYYGMTPLAFRRSRVHGAENEKKQA